MAEVGVWVSGRQRWVAGVTRKTTCDEVIEILLRRSDLPNPDTGQSYAIMERWRRVERPLDGRSRILKIWNAWGDAQNEVRFTLRRVDWDADSGRGSPGSSGTYRKRKHHHRNKLPSHLETIHPKRLNRNHGGTMEHLMKLILSQGETIHTQLRRLHDREHQIQHLETETHRSRVQTLGANYLLETYLSSFQSNPEDDVDKEGDSGVVTDQTPPAASPNVPEEEPHEEEETKEDLQDLQSRVELWEKLVEVTTRLEQEEESLVRLQEGHSLLRDLERTRIDLERGARELQQSSFILVETESLLDARRRYLRRLQAQVDASDKETDRLTTLGQETHQVASYNDTDSNSDTGLSSLHSSSEEGVYVLDTLV